MPVPAVNKGPLDLEAELLTLWRRLLKSEAVTVDDDFFASGGDSLLAMEMLIEVERLIGQPVPETILFGAETIRQLAPKIAMQTGMPATPFFQFHGRGDRPPLFFFNGDLVSGHLCVRRMVELFGPDYPIISIDPHGLRGDPIPPSIEGDGRRPSAAYPGKAGERPFPPWRQMQRRHGGVRSSPPADGRRPQG